MATTVSASESAITTPSLPAFFFAGGFGGSFLGASSFGASFGSAFGFVCGLPLSARGFLCAAGGAGGAGGVLGVAAGAAGGAGGVFVSSIFTTAFAIVLPRLYIL
jgi:hypothetical protein